MTTTIHQEHQDADNNRPETQIEFIFDEWDEEVIDELFKLQETDSTWVTLPDSDHNFYSIKVTKDYEVLECISA